MPELPEVEVTCRGIEPFLRGATITKITIREKRLRWPVSLPLFQLKNVPITKVSRRAKYILVDTSQGVMLIHLGMSGRLRVCENNMRAQKHDHVDIHLKNGLVLRYTDPRRFGCILWTTDPIEVHPLLKSLGPEPLTAQFNAKELFQRLQKKRTSIKQAVMDQEVVVGVGNIYANEALFLAKILPARKAGSLSMLECQRLVKAIKIVLAEAIMQGGTTLKDFFSPQGETGYFVQKLLVYGREQQACFICQHPLMSKRLGNRATVFCQQCQA